MASALIGIITVGVVFLQGFDGLAFLAQPTPTPTPKRIERVATQVIESAEIAAESASDLLNSAATQASQLASDGVAIVKTQSAVILTPEPNEETVKIPGTEIELPRITDEQEMEIGRKVDREVRATWSIYEDPQQLARVQTIGQQLAKVSDRPQLSYNFALIDQSDINAFAAPGGFIYVTSGMLNMVQGDDELAAVLGHEIAHVARRHGARRLETIAATEYLLELLARERSELDEIYEDRAVQIAASASADLLFKGWGRNQELEADEYGVLYMQQAGYDPQAAITLFERMQREFGQGDVNSAERLLRTHPPFADRIERVKETK